MPALPLFVTCPRGVEPLLLREIVALGATNGREAKGGVVADGSTETAYRICLWSRLASRVLLTLETFEAGDADALYTAARTVDWPGLFDPKHAFAVEVAGRTPGIANTHHAALRLKDAVVDVFRERRDTRPDVDTKNPAIRLHLHLDRVRCAISLDLAGDSLHRRGYRRLGGEAPLKENLACAILARCGWPEAFGERLALFDPMCGSGTFLIEGAWMAADVAPGLLRRYWGFTAWRDHQPALWDRVRAEAMQRRDAGFARWSAQIAGCDLDPRAIASARENIRRAGLDAHIQVELGDALESAALTTSGLLVCNPPYGERLSSETDLIRLYSLLGIALKARFAGWHCGLFTARDDVTPRLGLRAARMHVLHNGAIACKLLQFDIAAEAAATGPDAAADFANRLRKNYRHLHRWAARQGVTCYRVYDADLPDYALTVDLYQSEDGSRHAHVQEHVAPASVDPVRAEKRLRGALAAIVETLEIPPAHIHYKLRRSQKGPAQYQRQGEEARRSVVVEHGCRLAIDLDAYLDSGLFLDHRALRRRIQGEASGKRFLNLFCYTGTASVHAARGGAIATVSVDLSNTYLDWARYNLRLNGLRAEVFNRPPPESDRLPAHSLIRADARNWVAEQARRAQPSRFDLILLDPPTFSNSKKMEGTFDVRRDQVALIDDAMRLLAPGGTLYFSSNRRGFKLDPELADRHQPREITPQTLDEDFRRPRPAHRCWVLRSKPEV